MPTSTSLRRKLRIAWAEAQAANPAASLLETLLAKEARAEAALTGGSIEEIRANNRLTRFKTFGQGEITQLEIADCDTYLVDLFEHEIDRLEDAGDPATDADVYAAMMAALPSAREPINETTSDWSLARC